MGMHCCQSRHLPYCTSLVERPSLSIKHFCSSDSRPESYSLSIYLSLFLFFSFIYLSFSLSLSLYFSVSIPFFHAISLSSSLFLILSVTLSYGSICSVVFPITVTPQMINPQDTSLIVQTAIKNMTTNGVFYFGIPVSMEVRNIRNK